VRARKAALELINGRPIWRMRHRGTTYQKTIVCCAAAASPLRHPPRVPPSPSLFFRPWPPPPPLSPSSLFSFLCVCGVCMYVCLYVYMPLCKYVYMWRMALCAHVRMSLSLVRLSLSLSLARARPPCRLLLLRGVRCLSWFCFRKSAALSCPWSSQSESPGGNIFLQANARVPELNGP
jgi:hypothetical protein